MKSSLVLVASANKTRESHTGTAGKKKEEDIAKCCADCKAC
jgi:hypothetical protein